MSLLCIAAAVAGPNDLHDQWQDPFSLTPKFLPVYIPRASKCPNQEHHKSASECEEANRNMSSAAMEMENLGNRNLFLDDLVSLDPAQQ
jgi:hypothetical protein